MIDDVKYNMKNRYKQVIEHVSLKLYIQPQKKVAHK